MGKRSKPAADAAYFAMLGAWALASGTASPGGSNPDPKPTMVAEQGVAGGQEHGWFLLDSGFGYEGFPTLYRLDDGALSEIITPY